MAFNPFHQFRRYSKVVFAILAIICMFTFVLSSGMGRGDFFTQMTDWVTNRRRVPAMMTLYGKEYDALQVQQVQNRRRLASEYMELAVGYAQQNLTNRVTSGLGKLDPETQRMVQQILQTRLLYLSSGLVDRYVSEMLQSFLFRIHFMTIQAEGQTPKKQEVIDTLAALRALLSLDAVRFASRRPGESYFGGFVNQPQDTLDFLLWLHEADQRSIKLTDDDIAQAIRVETIGELTAASAGEIDKDLRKRYRTGYSKESLYAALGDELRARIAQGALLGAATSGGTRTRTAIPVVLTPEEYWELFKDARITVQVGMITMPVEGFLDQVKATPSEEELKRLFEKHKNDVPAPERAEPGFKEPRRLQIAWVGATPELPFYQKAAGKLQTILPALRLLGGTSAAALLGAPLALDAELLHQEEDFRRRELPWTDNFTPRMHTTSFWRPENVAILVGATVGGAAGGGTILSGPLALEGRAIVREIRDRAKVGSSIILTAGLEPQPFGVAGVVAGIPAEVTPKAALPLVRGLLRAKVEDELARSLVQNDLTAFRTEVTKRGAESDRTAVRKYIDEFIQERGLAHGATTEPRDQYNIINDPGLAPLKEAYVRGHGQQDVLLRGFGQAFFSDQSFEGGGIGLYTPQTFFTGDTSGKTYLYWRTEDIPARTPRFDKARAEVVEAWKRLQARELARKEAEHLADLARRAQGDVQKLRDLAAQHNGREFFELGPMARKVPQPNPLGTGRQYQDPTIPSDKIAYAGAELLQKLLDLRKDVKGTTVVVSDQPKKHFFVASLLQREEPKEDEFRQVYVNSMARSATSDTLLAELTSGRRFKYRQEVLEQLRAEAKATINEEARKRGGEEPVGE
jgi:hypothetical protein